MLPPVKQRQALTMRGMRCRFAIGVPSGSMYDIRKFVESSAYLASDCLSWCPLLYLSETAAGAPVQRKAIDGEQLCWAVARSNRHPRRHRCQLQPSEGPWQWHQVGPSLTF